jgi:hypothetical protein
MLDTFCDRVVASLALASQGKASAAAESVMQWLAAAFGLEQARPWSRPRVLFVVALVVAAFNFALSCGDVQRFGGADLRPRVVGARLLVLGVDPYRPLPEALSQNERLLDPRGPYRDATRCTYTPPLLAIYALFAWLPYLTQRLLWFALEWASLLFSIAWLARTIRPREARHWFVIPALVFFAGGSFWRLHVERGQYYSLILLLLAWSASELIARRHDDWRAGVGLGIAAALRPTVLVVAAPLWLLGYRKAAVATMAAAATVVVLLLPVSGVVFWKDYVRLVSVLERAAPGLPALSSPPATMRVEGADFTRVMESRSSNANIHLLLLTIAQRTGWPPTALVPALAKLTFLAVMAGFLAVLWRGRRAHWPARAALVAAFTAIVISDHFLPVRWGYVDVLYLAPLALVTPFMLRARRPVLLLTVLLALVLGHSLLWPLDAGAGSLVRAVLLTSGLVGWTLAVARRHPRVIPVRPG